MKSIKKIALLFWWLLLTIHPTINAVWLSTLRWVIGGDIDINTTRVEGTRSIFNIILLVNKYLWFAIWFFCFLFMVRNWFQLITAQGDSDQTKKATKSLIWAAIWIAVCLLAYIIVNIAVKLFS